MWVKSWLFTIQNKLKTPIWGERKHTSPGKCTAHALVNQKLNSTVQLCRGNILLQNVLANYLTMRFLSLKSWFITEKSNTASFTLAWTCRMCHVR